MNKWMCECGEIFSSGYECPVCGSVDVDAVDNNDYLRAQKKRDGKPSEED